MMYEWWKISTPSTSSINYIDDINNTGLSMGKTKETL